MMCPLQTCRESVEKGKDLPEKPDANRKGSVEKGKELPE